MTSPLVSPRNDVCGRSEEIPYWWRVTTKIWVVLLIGWSKFSSWHNQSEVLLDLDSDTRSACNICSRFSHVILWGMTSGGFAKCRLFSQEYNLKSIKLREKPILFFLCFLQEDSERLFSQGAKKQPFASSTWSWHGYFFWQKQESLLL